MFSCSSHACAARPPQSKIQIPIRALCSPHAKETGGINAYYKAGYPTEISGLYLSNRPEHRMLSDQSGWLLLIYPRTSVLEVDAGCVDVYGPAP